MAAPEHPRLTPEEAARCIKEAGESRLLTEQEIASGLRAHVEEFGPAEIDAGGVTYTVWAEDDEPYAPDLEGWAERLVDEIRRTPTDYQGHPDVPEEAALALVEALEPDDLRRFTDALLEAAPGFAERVTSWVLEELCEEVARCEDGRYAHATIILIKTIEEKWRRHA
ncbi:MAG: hypothetical protein M3P49_00460 [Actinomycetota bacterium]|nr:hypothetical protein [Actinomycetota bacterium]